MGMGAPMKVFVAFLILIGASLNSEFAAARKSSVLRADRVQISYVPPKNSAHEAIFQLLKERRNSRKIQRSFKRIASTACAPVEG